MQHYDLVGVVPGLERALSEDGYGPITADQELSAWIEDLYRDATEAVQTVAKSRYPRHRNEGVGRATA